MTNQKDYSPVNASQGLESLRASDFDTYSAIAELIDNSIQHTPMFGYGVHCQS